MVPDNRLLTFHLFFEFSSAATTCKWRPLIYGRECLSLNLCHFRNFLYVIVIIGVAGGSIAVIRNRACSWSATYSHSSFTDSKREEFIIFSDPCIFGGGYYVLSFITDTVALCLASLSSYTTEFSKISPPVSVTFPCLPQIGLAATEM